MTHTLYIYFYFPLLLLSTIGFNFRGSDQKQFQIITVMNIENLLKKLSQYPTQSKSDIAKQPYKIKTSQSFGTFNSLTDHSDTSFVIHDNSTPIRKKPIYTNHSNIDQSLSEIDKMKNTYEQRHKKQRSIQRSIERSSAGRSTQKHTLKPSNTPSFSKAFKLPAKVKDNEDSGVKDLSKDRGLRKQERKNSFKYIYPKSPESLDENNNPYEEPSLQFESQREESCEIFNEEFRISEKIKPKHQRNESKWELEDQLSSFIQKTQSRFQYTLNKLKDLEKQNEAMKAQMQSLTQVNQEYKETIEHLIEEKEKVQSARIMEKHEKQELEGLLKDLLYKRERQKLQTSKENTHRQNDRKNHLEMESKGHQKSTSKMKVQNLLQKLQIKVDRA